MHKVIRSFQFYTGIGVIALAFGLFAGCGQGCKTNPETVAYRTSATAHVTAVAALKAWADYVNVHHPSVEQEKKVQAALDTYKAAQLTLLDATKAYMEAGAPAPATAQERFDLALQAAGDALANLIGLIRSQGGRI